MRFLLLSLVVNLAILFIPFKLNFIQINKPELKAQKQINLKLNIQQPKPKKAPPKEEPKIIKPEVKPKPKPEIKPKPKQKVKPKLKPKPTPKKAKKILKKQENIIKKPIKTQENEKNTPKVSKTAKFEQKEIQEKIPTQNTPNSQDSVDFCVENIGFEILEKPSEKYPKKAKRLRINKIIKVEVHFKLGKNNEIQIIKTIGENEIFNLEAEKRTKKMKIKTLDKKVANCTIIQPYKFVP